MFNCLQEGIVVVKERKKEELIHGIDQHKIYFVNDIGNRILQKIFKTKR